MNKIKKSKFILLLILVALVAAVIFAARTQTNNMAPTEQGTGTPGTLEQLGTPPADNASTKDRESFGAKVRSSAASVDTVSVGPGCALSPAVISIKSGSALTFKNQDNTQHVLIVTEEIRINPNTDSTIKAVFNGPGTYGIVCDGPYPVGYIDLFE